MLADLGAQQTTLAYHRVLAWPVSHEHDVEAGVADDNLVDQRARCGTDSLARKWVPMIGDPFGGCETRQIQLPSRRHARQDLVLATARRELRHLAPRMIARSFVLGKLRRLQRTPHHLRELLILDLLRRIESQVHSTAISQPRQQIVARREPQLSPQCIRQLASLAPFHWRTVAPQRSDPKTSALLYDGVDDSLGDVDHDLADPVAATV